MTDEKKLTDFQEALLELIPETKEEAIKGRYLVNRLHLSRWQLKLHINKLRELGYPICSKQTEGGGYWIAETSTDIQEFINMMDARLKGTMTMRNQMLKLRNKKIKEETERKRA